MKILLLIFAAIISLTARTQAIELPMTPAVMKEAIAFGQSHGPGQIANIDAYNFLPTDDQRRQGYPYISFDTPYEILAFSARRA